MKTKTIKTIPPSRGYSSAADKVAEKYVAAKAAERDGKAQVASMREEASALIKTCGTKSGNVQTLQGDKFELSVLKVMSSPSVDSDMLYHALTPTQRLKVFTPVPVTYQLDEAALMQKVEDGSISRNIIEDCMCPSEMLSERLTVTERKTPGI